MAVATGRLAGVYDLTQRSFDSGGERGVGDFLKQTRHGSTCPQIASTSPIPLIVEPFRVPVIRHRYPGVHGLMDCLSHLTSVLIGQALPPLIRGVRIRVADLIDPWVPSLGLHRPSN